MSVYSNPVYRDDALQAAARVFGLNPHSLPLLERLSCFTIEDPGRHALPEGLQAGNLQDQLPDNVQERIRLLSRIIVKNGGAKHSHVVASILAHNPKRVFFGLAAVYKVWARLVDRAKERDITKEMDVNIFRYLFNLGTYLGKHTMRDANAQFLKYIDDFSKECYPMFVMFRNLVKVANAYSMRRWRNDVSSSCLSKTFLGGLDTKEAVLLGYDRVYPFNGLLVLCRHDSVFVLTRNDTDRLERLMLGDGLASFYYRTYGRLDTQRRQRLLLAYHSYRAEVLKAAKQKTFEQLQLLCRACDVAYHTVLAKLASDVSDHSYQDQLDKARKENLNDVLDLNVLVKSVDDLPPREALEVMQYYKILPQADFDYFGAAKRQEDLYAQVNKIEDQNHFRLIMRHHKHLMIRAYHARHGMCPGKVMMGENLPHWADKYPWVRPEIIAIRDVDIIDLGGSFAYKDHYLDCWDLIKDKAICPLEIETVKDVRDLQKLAKQSKNQLLDYINRRELYGPARLYEAIDNLFCDVKTDDKAEAKKPHGRWFMEAHTDIRMLLSEYEMSVAEYGKHLEGFMQGKGLRERQKMMNHVTEALPSFEGKTQLFISFDVAKWSPRLPIVIHEELDKQWANAFGLPHIERLNQIFSKGKMHYVKGRLHHTIEKTGNDFEGFCGKKLTFYHLAVMHAAVDEMKAQKLIFGSARYAAQIDDGVMRVHVDLKTDPDVVGKLRKFLSGFWLKSGAELSWDKTFISKGLVVFLNEVRIMNRSITPGIRAFTKIRNHGNAICPNILDDVSTLESTVRGAYVSGAIPLQGYFVYCFLMLDLVKKWGPKRNDYKISHILWMFAPVALGGLGMCNLMSLLGSVDFEPVETGIGNLLVISNAYPRLAPIVNNILNQELRPVSDMSSVTNPGSVRRENTILKSDRVVQAMRKSVVDWFQTPVLRDYMFPESAGLFDSCSSVIARMADVPVELRELWYDSLPVSAVDAIVNKVLTSRTAQEFVPRRTLYRIVIANVFEARKVISLWQ